jgi:hypothetical protein
VQFHPDKQAYICPVCRHIYPVASFRFVDLHEETFAILQKAIKVGTPIVDALSSRPKGSRY